MNDHVFYGISQEGGMALVPPCPREKLKVWLHTVKLHGAKDAKP